MMKLSSMLKIVETVDDKWRSSLAEQILESWEYDKKSLYYFRSSANFIFVFKKDGEWHFLRFIEKQERNIDALKDEIDILFYLSRHSIRVAEPVQSKNKRYIEAVETELGIFYAVVFKGLDGKQYEVEQLREEQFLLWGRTLGKLHQVLKKMPKDFHQNRATWKDHLNFVTKTLPESEWAAYKELEKISTWASNLSITSDNFGIVHYDFELDNLCINKDEVGIIDFDDCANYWYVADIAYALRDIFHEGVDMDHPFYQVFLKGYTLETTVDKDILRDLPLFMRMHQLIIFAKMLRTVDIPESKNHPEWLQNLRKKLMKQFIEDTRERLEKLHS
ncbi:phosphotransferase [Bacillus pfraonensis]|uniref:phosphotransferase enzyme family protein n=1 Tax=Bacillus TaxID=1386 RepID=UPI002A57FCB7|nr:phosphotransferase [Bacillus pseudomycoides]